MLKVVIIDKLVLEPEIVKSMCEILVLCSIIKSWDQIDYKEITFFNNFQGRINNLIVIIIIQLEYIIKIFYSDLVWPIQFISI